MEVLNKKNGQPPYKVAYEITRRPPDQADPQVLNTNRGHWCIENSWHYILDWKLT
jgi:hypothetical protein